MNPPGRTTGPHPCAIKPRRLLAQPALQFRLRNADTIHVVTNSIVHAVAPVLGATRAAMPHHPRHHRQQQETNPDQEHPKFPRAITAHRQPFEAAA
jgi:hypothetical protein